VPVPGSRDIALISLGTTPGLRRADAAFEAAAQAAGVSCDTITVEIGGRGKLRRQITVTDLVEAAAARKAARGVDARVVVFSTVTTALLRRPRVPYAIRFDSPALLNRPGAAGLWQRLAERRAMNGARVLLPWGEAAADALPAPLRSRTTALHVPIEVAYGPGSRDIDVLAYAGYPEKRGLDIVVRAWAGARGATDAARLVIAGIERERGEAWLRERGVETPPGVEWRGLMPRGEWDALLGRARIFVNASRREDHGLSQLEALAAGAMLVTVPSLGPYEALPIAKRLDPRFVADGIDASSLAFALRAGLEAVPGDYAERAQQELEPYRRDAVQRVFEERVLPALGLR
jgi:glycosyltransferase involved in cell wall biosynthesis